MGGGNFSAAPYFESLTVDEFWEHWQTHTSLIEAQKARLSSRQSQTKRNR